MVTLCVRTPPPLQGDAREWEGERCKFGKFISSPFLSIGGAPWGVVAVEPFLSCGLVDQQMRDCEERTFPESVFDLPNVHLGGNRHLYLYTYM